MPPTQRKIRAHSELPAGQPKLFINGTQDPLTTKAGLEGVTRVTPQPLEVVWLEGAEHDFDGHEADIAARVVAFISRHFQDAFVP